MNERRVRIIMDFQKRLEKAIERGHRTNVARAREEAERELSEKELQRLHSQNRLELCEHIERCLRQLADRFPGFRFETILDARGWGSAISRENINLRPGQRKRTSFSRLEMIISPISGSFILELTAKATVCNRELFSRNHYQRLAEADLEAFTDIIDLWTLEYAEQYAAEG
jgi:hypothetical protein